MILQTFLFESAIIERAISKNYIPYGKIMSTDGRYDNKACQLSKYRVIEGRLSK